MRQASNSEPETEIGACGGLCELLPAISVRPYKWPCRQCARMKCKPCRNSFLVCASERQQEHEASPEGFHQYQTVEGVCFSVPSASSVSQLQAGTPFLQFLASQNFYISFTFR